MQASSLATAAAAAMQGGVATAAAGTATGLTALNAEELSGQR